MQNPVFFFIKCGVDHQHKFGRENLSIVSNVQNSCDDVSLPLESGWDNKVVEGQHVFCLNFVWNFLKCMYWYVFLQKKATSDCKFVMEVSSPPPRLLPCPRQVSGGINAYVHTYIKYGPQKSTHSVAVTCNGIYHFHFASVPFFT